MALVQHLNLVLREGKLVLTLVGAGGGGNAVDHNNTSSAYIMPGDGVLSVGGNASLSDHSNGLANASGGGAGCNPGIGLKSSNAVSVSDGSGGTGGLLIVYAKKINLKKNSYFSATGSERRFCNGRWARNIYL